MVSRRGIDSLSGDVDGTIEVVHGAGPFESLAKPDPPVIQVASSIMVALGYGVYYLARGVDSAIEVVHRAGSFKSHAEHHT